MGRMLSQKFNTALKLDLSWYKNTPETDTPRTYLLEKFNIDATEASLEEIYGLKPHPIIIRINNALKKYLNFSLNFKTYCNKSFMSLSDFSSLHDSLYLEGEWCGSSYFEDIRDLLANELTLKNIYAHKAKSFLDTFNNNEILISLHVRRGDFIKNPNAAKFHCCCSEKYYKKSIKFFKNKLPDFKLLVFSDELDWVKKNFPFLNKNNAYYIENFNEITEFYIMTKCNHNIIANSGFSWFSAWLNQNKNKIVIAPQFWFRDKRFNKQFINLIKNPYSIFIEN